MPAHRRSLKEVYETVSVTEVRGPGFLFNCFWLPTMGEYWAVARQQKPAPGTMYLLSPRWRSSTYDSQSSGNIRNHVQFNLYTNTGAASQCLNNEDLGGKKERLSPRGAFIFSPALRWPPPPWDACSADTRINGILAGRKSMFSVIVLCSCDSVVLPPSSGLRVDSWRPLFAEQLSSRVQWSFSLLLRELGVSYSSRLASI